MNEQLAPEPTTSPAAPDGFTQASGLPAVPIVIGVVGHRGIRPGDREILEKKLTKVFKEFKAAYPNTPLVVLSALAEGADQVAARAAIASGAFVRAPLPFEPAIYRQSTSFDTDAERLELDRLLADPKVESFVVPLPKDKDKPGTDWLRVAKDRTDEACKKLRYACYANAGGYITRRCNVLIALQDGRDEGQSRGPSGTAEYVAFKLNGRPPSAYPWTSAEPLGYRNERRLVMVIDTPRADPAPPTGKKGDLKANRPVGEPEVFVPNDDDDRWFIPRNWLPLPGRIDTPSRFWSRVKVALGFHPVSSEDSPRRLREGCELLLIPSATDVTELPTYDKSRIIVAVVDKVLHFRLFDEEGKMIVDTDTRSLKEQARPMVRLKRLLKMNVDTDARSLKEQARSMVRLRRLLKGLWPPHVLQPDEKARVIDAVTWIVSHPARLRLMEAELRQFRETCTNVDDFNRDLARPEVESDIRRRLAKEAELRVPQLDDQHNRWLLRFSRIREGAAALSGFLQPQQDQALIDVLFLLGLAVLAFHVYAHLFDIDMQFEHSKHNPLFLVVFLALLLVAAAVVIHAWWTRLDERRLDSRALAEGLRVRRAWSMAGVGRSVADSYAGQVRNEMSWIRQALLHVCPPPQVWLNQFDPLRDDQKLELLRRVRKEWVRGQIEQHRRAHRKQHESAVDSRRAGFGLAVVGWIILAGVLFSDRFAPASSHRPDHAGPLRAAVAVVGGFLEQAVPRALLAPKPHAPPSPRYPKHELLILASCLVIVGGLCIAYCERRTYEELSKQYERMAILFANGDRVLEGCLARGEIEDAQRAIEALGHEAIIEHAQWLILRRARQLELHIGG